MKSMFVASTALLVLLGDAAAAEVVTAAPGGFTVRHETVIAAGRAESWGAAVDEIARWWSADHTVSGSSERLSITAKPLGCFCESLGGDDGVVHLVVTSVSAPVMLRMTGALGPLGLMGVDGNMTWEFFDDVAGTRVRFTYAVGGYYDKGLDSVAVPVDTVIGDALERLKEYIERD